MGVKILTYIDNWLILAYSQQEARSNTELVIQNIMLLGMNLAWDSASWLERGIERDGPASYSVFHNPERLSLSPPPGLMTHVAVLPSDC